MNINFNISGILQAVANVMEAEAALFETFYCEVASVATQMKQQFAADPANAPLVERIKNASKRLDNAASVLRPKAKVQVKSSRKKMLVVS
jgi:hypothetical protein